MRIELPFGPGSMPVDIPDANLGEIVRPHPVSPAPDWRPILTEALANPIGSPRLESLLKPGQKVAILIDDSTRTTPVDVILPMLLAAIHDAGIPRDAVSIVIALGTHRPMTAAEINQKVGREIAETYRIVNTNSRQPEHFVLMGESSSGIPARVNKAVAEADVRIGLGQILPHLDAGFSGGAKIVLPGVCSRETVESFHQKELYLNSNQLGQVDSPVRTDIEQFVDDCVPLHFIVNVVMTADHKPYKAVAGHFIAAHREGVRACQEVYGVPVKRKYPIVIASAYPKDMDLWQTTTIMWSGPLMLEPGGTLIMLSHASDRHSAYPDFPIRIGTDPDVQLGQIERGELHEPISAIMATMIGRFLHTYRFALVSEGLTDQDAAQMGFDYFSSLNNALKAALEHHGSDASVGIMTQGSVTFPMLEH